MHERKHLPLRRVSKHCRRDSERAPKQGEIGVKTFELMRATDSAQAVASAAKSKTAQQGADIRFIAGGTTLIDLMKLNVETPQKLVDVTRLPLGKIDNLPDGGLAV